MSGQNVQKFTEKGDGGIVGNNGGRTRTPTIRLDKQAVFCADLLIPVLVVPPPLFVVLLAAREVQIVNGGGRGSGILRLLQIIKNKKSSRQDTVNLPCQPTVFKLMRGM